MKKKFILKFFMLMMINLGLITQLSALQFDIEEINPNLKMDSPIFSNDKGALAWDSNDGNDAEIFYYMNGQVIQLTDNDYNDYAASISNGQIVWKSWLDQDGELLMFDGANIIQLTDNSINESYYSIDNGLVIWQMSDGSDQEMMLYDGKKTIQISDDDENHYNSMIHNGYVVWASRGSWQDYYYSIHMYNYATGERIKIADKVYPKPIPKVYDGKVVWINRTTDDKTSAEVFLYDAGNITQITNDTIEDFTVNIDNTQIIWVNDDNAPYPQTPKRNLYRYYLKDQTREIIKEDINLYRGQYSLYPSPPSLDNSLVCWAENIIGQYDIYCADQAGISSILDNEAYIGGVRSDNGNLVWMSNSILYIGTPKEETEPADITILYKNRNVGGTFDEKIQPAFQLVNNSNEDVALSELTLRYWYNNENPYVEQQLVVDFIINDYDYSTPGSWPYSYIQSRYVGVAADKQDYMRITFTDEAGTLYANSSVRLEVSINSKYWENYNETNDYSCDLNAIDYIEWDKITLYQNGKLIWGTEPQ